MVDFTGDYSGEATIEFNEPISESVIMQIEEVMKRNSSKWRMIGSKEYECVLAEPDLASKPSNDVVWRLSRRRI